MKYLSSKDAITFIEPGKKFIIVSSSDLNYKDIYLNRNSITYDELSQIFENRKAPLYEYDGFSIKAYASSTRISYNGVFIDTDIRIFKSLKEKVSGLFNKEDVFDAIKNYVNFLKKAMTCGLSSKEKSKLIEYIISGNEIIDDDGNFYLEKKVDSTKYFELKINSSTDIVLNDSTQYTMNVFLKCDLSDKKDDSQIYKFYLVEDEIEKSMGYFCIPNDEKVEKTKEFIDEALKDFTFKDGIFTFVSELSKEKFYQKYARSLSIISFNRLFGSFLQFYC